MLNHKHNITQTFTETLTIIVVFPNGILFWMEKMRKNVFFTYLSVAICSKEISKKENSFIMEILQIYFKSKCIVIALNNK